MRDQKTFLDVHTLVSPENQKLLIAILDKVNAKLESAISSEKGDKVLVLAAINKFYDLVEKLIEAGANVYAKAGDTSLLSYAAQRGWDDIISLLIRYGAERFLADEPEKALYYAVNFEYMNTVDILLTKTPYDPIKDRLSFISAAKSRDTRLIKKWMESNSHEQKDFIEALSAAIRWNAQDTISLLLDVMSESSINESLLTCTNISNLAIIQLLFKRLTEISDKNKSTTLSNHIEKLQQMDVKLRPLPSIIYKLDGLSLSDAIYCLYHLAENSEKGRECKSHGLQLTASVSGLYVPLSKQELESELRQYGSSSKIGSIGYLYLGIPILSDCSLDFAYYLQQYNLCEQTVRLALDGLKQSVILPNEKKISIAPSLKVTASTSQQGIFSALPSSEKVIHQTFEPKSDNDKQVFQP